MPSGGKLPGEFELIARFFAPLATDTAALGLRDDAAVLMVSEGHELVVTCDTLVEGVHFLKDDPPDSIGHKALAINLSDLAAKGARPCAYLLSLALPAETRPAWLDGFAAGLRGMQESCGIALIGGDTTASPGPLIITITALGLVGHGHAVLRLGAKPGDKLYVSGTIGDAYLGLRLLKDARLGRTWRLSKEDAGYLIDRYRRPGVRNDLILLVRNFAQAAIDVSDGLVLDVEKLCEVSHIGAVIEAERAPLSAAARKVLNAEPALRAEIITAGDDYEVVAAIPENSAAAFESEAEAKGARFSLIGVLVSPEEGVTVIDGAGRPLKLKRKGFRHF
ncbi:MAG: thiamine-phosphate kinase [Methyloceanibacter sp.]